LFTNTKKNAASEGEREEGVENLKMLEVFRAKHVLNLAGEDAQPGPSSNWAQIRPIFSFVLVR